MHILRLKLFLAALRAGRVGLNSSLYNRALLENYELIDEIAYLRKVLNSDNKEEQLRTRVEAAVKESKRQLKENGLCG